MSFNCASRATDKFRSAFLYELIPQTNSFLRPTQLRQNSHYSQINRLNLIIFVSKFGIHQLIAIEILTINRQIQKALFRRNLDLWKAH